MGTIAVKRVYDPPESDDGFRVLVDRLWPRGLTKAAAALDLWAKQLAPSPDLRREFNHRPERFAEFTHHYRAELAQNPAVTVFLSQLKKSRVTLLYGARDPNVNHAIVLADYLRKTSAAMKRKKAAPVKKPAKKPAKKSAKKPVKKKISRSPATQERSP